MTYTITGASGHTGSLIAQQLLAAGQTVRVIGRHADTLQPLVDLGAQAFVGDMADAAFLTNVFTGANAVYALIPPHYGAPDVRAFQNQIATSIVDAIKASGVTHVAALSSVGAHLPQDGGVVQGLYDFEQMLGALSGVNVCVLRPTWFMENFYGQIELIKNMGIMGMGVKPDIKIPMVVTSDIAAVAARHLFALDFKGVEIQYVLGSRDYDLNETASIIGTAIGKPDLKYVQFPYDQVAQSMVSSGMSQSISNAMAEFMKSINEGKVQSAHTRDAGNTTPTSLETFAQQFAMAYKAG
jgi:uncharacterized protein YbjT (DUF2867 family)